MTNEQQLISVLVLLTKLIVGFGALYLGYLMVKASGRSKG